MKSESEYHNFLLSESQNIILALNWITAVSPRSKVQIIGKKNGPKGLRGMRRMRTGQ